jgi:hypothetical protein
MAVTDYSTGTNEPMPASAVKTMDFDDLTFGGSRHAGG